MDSMDSIYARRCGFSSAAAYRAFLDADSHFQWSRPAVEGPVAPSAPVQPVDRGTQTDPVPPSRPGPAWLGMDYVGARVLPDKDLSAEEIARVDAEKAALGVVRNYCKKQYIFSRDEKSHVPYCSWWMVANDGTGLPASDREVWQGHSDERR